MRALVSQRMVRVFECIRMRSQVPRMRILCASARAVPALECQPACSASPRGLGRGREHLLLLPVFRRVALATCSRNRCRHPTPLQLPTAAYGILEFFQRCHPLDSFFCLCRSKKVTRVFCRGGRFCRGAVCRVVETGDAQEEGRRAWGRHGEEVPSQE